MMESLSIAKFLRPRVILVEQVNGFLDHPHKQFFLRQIRWAGYSLHWSRVLDASVHCAASRKRWLAMLIRVGDPVMIPMPFESWPIPSAPIHADALGAVLGGELAQDGRLFPSDETLKLCKRHDLLPPNKKPGTATNLVLQSRCTDVFGKTPTFMASYGKQHMFDVEYLKVKGLMAHFLTLPDGTIRYWHPIEILMLHRATGFHFIPHDWSLAWRFLGNQICVPHALLLLANAFKMMPQRAGTVSIQEIFQCMQQHCLRVDTLFFQETLLGHFVSELPVHVEASTLEHIARFGMCVSQDRLKTGHYWTLHSSGPWTSVYPDAILTMDFVSQASASDVISPTCQFFPVMKGIIHVSPNPIPFWFSAELAFEEVLKAWGGYFQRSMTHEPTDEIALHLIPCHEKFESNAASDMLCLYREGLVTLLTDSPQSRNAVSEQGVLPLFDQFGPISDLTSFSDLILSERNPELDILPKVNIMALFAAFTQAHCSSCFDKGTFTYEIDVCGEQQAVNTVVSMWSELSMVGLDSFGWKLDIVVLPDESQYKKVGLRFSPMTDSQPIASSALRVLLTVRAFRALVVGIEHPNGTPVTFKWMSRCLKTCRVLPDIVMSVFHRIMQIAFLPPCGRLEDDGVRTIHKGCNLTPEQRLSSCEKSQKSDSVVLHFLFSMHGGGETTGTKAGFQTQIRNSIASTLLQEGYELGWVSSCIDKLVQGVGVRKLAPISAKPPGTQRLEDILTLIRQTGVTIPSIKPALSSKASLQHKAKKHAPAPLDARNYKVVEGSIKNADGTDAIQISDFRNGACGFSLVSPEFAVPWVRSNQIVSSDELGLLVLGDPPCESPMDKQVITIPCRDEFDREVLLAVNLYQFGQKKLTLKEFEKHHVNIDSTVQIALTLWREDWPTEWNNVTKNVNQFIRNVLQQDEAIVSTWGRSFRKGRNATTPADATSCQIHCSVKESHLSKFLQNTGHNLIWATPKTQEGRPSTQFRLIWLATDTEFPDAIVLGAQIRGALGLHRSKGRLAIRVGKGDFDAAWNEIYPHLDPPIDVETVHTFKLEVLPFGTTASSLQEWAKCVKWTIKPFRALGPRSWLVGSPDKPPASLHFNGCPVLASLIPARTQHVPSPIVAGPKPLPSTKPNPTVGPPGQNPDPWAAWTGPRIQPQNATASGQVRSITGPVETQLNQQNERIDKLEAALGSLKDVQTRQSDDIKRTAVQVQKGDEEIRQHLDKRLTEVRRELDQSFSAAIQQQSKSFDSNLQDIKRLLLQTKRKSNDDSTMED